LTDATPATESSPTASAGSGQADSAMARHRLGTQLRQLREGCSLRLEEVAARLDVAPSRLSRIETGKAPVRTSYLMLMLDLYKVVDPLQRQMLTELALTGRAHEWATFGRLLHGTMVHYLGLEAAASKIYTFDVLTVPGLLQTPEYAAAIHRTTSPTLTAEESSWLRHVAVRRQRLVSRSQVQIHAVIDQAALCRPVGPDEALADQLDHLLQVMAAGDVIVQVVGLDTAWTVLSMPFTVLSFASPADPEVACWPAVGGNVTMTRTSRAVSTTRGTFQALAESAVSPTDTARLIRKLAARARSLDRTSTTD
jgi:transcriptional regulator with XRE-family HTH domain